MFNFLKNKIKKFISGAKEEIEGEEKKEEKREIEEKPSLAEPESQQEEEKTREEIETIEKEEAEMMADVFSAKIAEIKQKEKEEEGVEIKI